MSLTGFELFYLAIEPLVMPLHRQVRRQLLELARSSKGSHILDVGGRKSHYTVGIPGQITISDLPRETAIQKQLNLGLNQEAIQQTRKRRSNVHQIVLDDMTHSSLPAAAFDCVVAVEVLEHVERDDLFVTEVNRVLKSGGTFLMTTPNGDSVANRNPDHKRHYTREQLQALLGRAFGTVRVEYAIVGGRFRTLGLRPWFLSRPLYTAAGMAGNVINSIQSSRQRVKEQAMGTRHLVAVAVKNDLTAERRSA